MSQKLAYQSCTPYLRAARIGLDEDDGGEDGGAQDEDAGEGVRREEVAGAAAEGAHVVAGVDQGT